MQHKCNKNHLPRRQLIFILTHLADLYWLGLIASTGWGSPTYGYLGWHTSFWINAKKDIPRYQPTNSTVRTLSQRHPNLSSPVMEKWDAKMMGKSNELTSKESFHLLCKSLGTNRLKSLNQFWKNDWHQLSTLGPENKINSLLKKWCLGRS